ncbi:hypothetical protein CDAR_417171 [Caerostris darwini]|uniref:Uncharacterized protein n=1 Tax=Caerostris darwini TaxID=1538125 RepID=A0AAV4X968_9ARAC|nr:hypothetical protein CDAR_417171 [Caerostris darwini]
MGISEGLNVCFLSFPIQRFLTSASPLPSHLFADRLRNRLSALGNVWYMLLSTIMPYQGYGIVARRVNVQPPSTHGGKRQLRYRVRGKFNRKSSSKKCISNAYLFRFPPFPWQPGMRQEE